MRTKAFTLLELIFVIVIIGILVGTGFYYFKPHYLQNDRDFLELKLNTVRYAGVNYDKRNPSLGIQEINYSIGCISKDDFFQSQGTVDQHYKKHATVTLNPNKDILCFDTLGRVHIGTDANKTEEDSLATSDIIITLAYNGEEKNITIDRFTGDLR